MLSVSKPDKSSQFINKIDGVAYHQFLLCVFPYTLSKASMLSHQLISSLPESRHAQVFRQGALIKPHYGRYIPPLLDQMWINVGKCFKASAQFGLYVLSVSATTLKPRMVEVSTVDRLTTVQDSVGEAWILTLKGDKMPQTKLYLSYMRCTHPWVPSENISCGHDRCHSLCLSVVLMLCRTMVTFALSITDRYWGSKITI